MKRTLTILAALPLAGCNSNSMGLNLLDAPRDSWAIDIMLVGGGMIMGAAFIVFIVWLSGRWT